jgi:phosphodiesterase/alkaline phosphatase D-like protein
VADAVAIVLAEVAGLHALKQCHRLSSAQVEAEKVFEKVEPLQHRGGHRRPEQAYRLRGNPHIKFFNNQRGYVRHVVTPERWQADFQVVRGV